MLSRPRCTPSTSPNSRAVLLQERERERERERASESESERERERLAKYTAVAHAMEQARRILACVQGLSLRPRPYERKTRGDELFGRSLEREDNADAERHVVFWGRQPASTGFGV